MKKNTYSLIIPVSNNEKTLSTLFESILRQKYFFDEILLINNGSLDNSYDICKKYKENNKNVKLINIPKNNVSRARNIGIRNSTSEYILFLDADDYISDDYLLKIESIIENNKQNESINLFEFNFINIYKNKKIIKNEYILASDIYNFSEYISLFTNKFREESKFMCWKYIYKREFLIKNAIFFDESINLLEDIDFIFSFNNKIGNICVSNIIYPIFYVQRSGSITNYSKNKDYYESILKLSKKNYFYEYNKYFKDLSVKTLSFRYYINICNDTLLYKNKIYHYTYFVWYRLKKKISRINNKIYIIIKKLIFPSHI